MLYYIIISCLRDVRLRFISIKETTIVIELHKIFSISLFNKVKSVDKISVLNNQCKNNILAVTNERVFRVSYRYIIYFIDR